MNSTNADVQSGVHEHEESRLNPASSPYFDLLTYRDVPNVRGPVGNI
jgi:hypothetical protein